MLSKLPAIFCPLAERLGTTTLRAETFAGRNFRASKKTRNLWNKLPRFRGFGTNFVEKTFANRAKSLFSREKTFANEQKNKIYF